MEGQKGRARGTIEDLMQKILVAKREDIWTSNETHHFVYSLEELESI